ncbi:MAG: immunoglobulin domain-containing protein [Limisphaerales bacterium]
MRRVARWAAAALITAFLTFVEASPLAPLARAQPSLLPFADAFADRGVLSGSSGSGSGSNVGATLEPNEPRHGAVPGGSSVWLTWTAPSDGLVTFSTAGSDFDTVLAAYAYDSELKNDGSGPRDPSRPFADLREVARLDDSSNTHDSLIEFGVRQGVRYAIAVDGFRGASGAIVFSWNLLEAADIVPTLITVERDRSLQAGDTLTLSVELVVEQGGDDDVDLKWYRDDEELENEESPTLVIQRFSEANVGTYRVRVRSGRIRFFSAPIEIQLNSEGQIVVLARDKPAHALESALIGAPDAPGLFNSTSPRATPIPHSRGPLSVRTSAFGVTRGFNGSQIFSTAYAGRDAGEPLHCNIPGGASYWFAYVPPAEGTLTFDTDNSTFDTVLAVYTFEPPFSGYSDLISVACDDNAGPNAVTSRVEFTAEADRTYLVVVDGVNGARGFVHLQYRLTTQPNLVPPAITSPPTPLSVTEGDVARFAVVASGSEPFSFQWRFNTQPIPDALSDSLTLHPAAPDLAGLYDVVVANAAGSITSAPVRLIVLPRPVPPAITSPPTPLTVTEGDAARFAVVASGSEPFSFQWRFNTQPIPDALSDSLTLHPAAPDLAGLYDVVVANAAGSITSAPVTLRFIHRIQLNPTHAGGLLRLSFQSALGWTYHLESSEGPDDAWTRSESRNGTGDRLVIDTPVEPWVSRIFRVRAE